MRQTIYIYIVITATAQVSRRAAASKYMWNMWETIVWYHLSTQCNSHSTRRTPKTAWCVRSVKVFRLGFFLYKRYTIGCCTTLKSDFGDGQFLRSRFTKKSHRAIIFTFVFWQPWGHTGFSWHKVVSAECVLAGDLFY